MAALHEADHMRDAITAISTASPAISLPISISNMKPRVAKRSRFKLHFIWRHPLGWSNTFVSIASLLSFGNGLVDEINAYLSCRMVNASQ
jgi:hypothetical protein